MSKTLEERVESLLIGIMSDGFNRSLGALQKAGAIETKEMRREYKGIGSRYYDLVTEELEYTARYAAPEVIKAISKALQEGNK